MPDAEEDAPRHMPCDMGCQPDWHHDECAVYLPVASDAPSCWRGCPIETGTGLQRHQWPCDLSGTTTRVTPTGGSDV